MVSRVRCFEKFTIPRIAQLTQRSNQFNLRTVRYTEEEIEKISSSKDYITLSFSLKDKFGDYGLICVIIMNKKGESLFVDTWIMSCRVLKRGMEHFVLNHMVASAKRHGYVTLIGEYLPTAKNGLVKDHYQKLGFKEKQGLWLLNVSEFEAKKTFIASEEQHGNNS
jgi:FkbH-like protein